MPKPKSETEYVSNNSFMTSQVKIPKPFGSDYEDPLETLKAQIDTDRTANEPSFGSKPAENTDKNQTDLSGLTKLTEPTELTELTELIYPVRKHPTSPERDFTKTPNSIGRHVMAKGLFRGKSKQIYDYLWTASRGGINPSRTVRKTHSELQNGTGIGSLNTIKNGLKYLEQIGLINKTSAVGEASGNIYEMFTPEEVNLTDEDRPDRSVSSVSSVSQKMVQPVRPETGRTNLTQVVLESEVYSDSKTSFKDKRENDDDTRTRDGFSVMNERLDAATKKITGRGVAKREAEAWGNLADLLILELEVATKRTDGISSVPAFLTEILRRQFFVARQQKSFNKSAKGKIDTVGKSETGSYEIKPLNVKERESALEQLREFANDEFLENFKKWYTAEDWEYFVENLKKLTMNEEKTATEKPDDLKT